MSNSTSRFSMSNNSGSNSNPTGMNSRENKNKQLEEHSVQQNSPMDPNESTLLTTVRMNNLNSLLSSFTQFNIPIQFLSEPKTEGCSTSGSMKKPYFVLEDLWDCFKELGAFGVGVPLTLNNGESVLQYFNPYLSAVQLYVEDEGLMKKSNTKESSSSLSSKKKTKAKVLYQYFEYDKPFHRPCLHSKVTDLAMEHPCLITCRSSDLSPSSWFSVAWYPFYRIPAGSTLENIETAFLTYHNLSTPPITENQAELHDGPWKMALGIFGLTTYKSNASILPLPAASESQQMNSLLKAADDWLENLQVYHHDHSHFVSNR